MEVIGMAFLALSVLNLFAALVVLCISAESLFRLSACAGAPVNSTIRNSSAAAVLRPVRPARTVCLRP